MFLNMDSMTEAKSGEIKIEDFKAETIETFIYYVPLQWEGQGCELD